MEIVDRFVAREIAVGIVTAAGLAAVVKARQAHGPVGVDEMEGVPTLRGPGVADLPAFEHDMVDARLSQVVAGGQPGAAGADHDDVGSLA